MNDDDATDLGIEDLTGAVEVGAGGFGTVYRARQESLRRDVAVKVVSNTIKDQKVRIRFEREIQAMGMLSGHPNIVTVYDSGFTRSGQPYILMDYMEQGSLGDRLDREGALPHTDVLDIMVKVCGALETAHQAGILHRDLKPENVLVNGYGEPKLGDFGIARLKGGPETGTSSLTASIEHVPPELLEAQAPDVRSDLYALGSTIFKLLTGTAAFIRPEDESIVPALTRIRDEPVPDLRQRGVPADVADVVERAMAKQREERYSSAIEMGQGLREAQRRLGLMTTTMPIREEDAAAARESTRTINSDDLARSMEDLGLGPATGQTGLPPNQGAPPLPPGPTGPHPAPPYQSQPHPLQSQPQPSYGQPAQGYGTGPVAHPTGPHPTGPPQTAPGYGTGPYQAPGGGAKGTPWGLILGGLGAVVLLAVIAVAVLSGGDTTEQPTDPPTTPDVTPTPTPTPTATDVVEGEQAYAAYERLTDDSDSLVVEAPREWTDVDGSPWLIQEEQVGDQIEAAPDIEGFRTTWSVPGLIFGASETLRDTYDPEGLLDVVSFADECDFDGREPYRDPLYTGFRDEYSNCGGTDSGYTIIAAEPATQDRILLVQFQSVTERDRQALQRALDSFVVVADATAASEAAADGDGGAGSEQPGSEPPSPAATEGP